MDLGHSSHAYRGIAQRVAAWRVAAPAQSALLVLLLSLVWRRGEGGGCGDAQEEEEVEYILRTAE